MRLRHVVHVDATNESAMPQLGVEQFDIAVVAIGDSIEASLLATGVLLGLGRVQEGGGLLVVVLGPVAAL